MPFYPLGGYVCAEIYREIESASVYKSMAPRLSFIPLLWFWLAIAMATRLGTDFSSNDSILSSSRSLATAVAGDLERVMHDYPGKHIEMGYGEWNSKYELSYLRPALVFAGNPLTIDAVALADMQLSGIDNIPHGTLQYLQECRTQIWLIPKDEPPFAMVNVYSLIDPRVFPKHLLFSDEFRRIFFQQYRKQNSSKYFDIWECKTESERRPNLND